MVRSRASSIDEGTVGVLSPNTEGYLSPRVLSPPPEGFLSPLKNRMEGEHSPKSYSVLTDRSLSLTGIPTVVSGSTTPLNTSGKANNTPHSATPPPGTLSAQALWGKMRTSVLHQNNKKTGSRSVSPLPRTSTATIHDAQPAVKGQGLALESEQASAQGPELGLGTAQTQGLGLSESGKGKTLWNKLQNVVLLSEEQGGEVGVEPGIAQGQGLGLETDTATESNHAPFLKSHHQHQNHSQQRLNDSQTTDQQSYLRRESARDMLGIGPSLSDRGLGLGLGQGQRSKGVSDMT